MTTLRWSTVARLALSSPHHEVRPLDASSSLILRRDGGRIVYAAEWSSIGRDTVAWWPGRGRESWRCSVIDAAKGLGLVG